MTFLLRTTGPGAARALRTAADAPQIGRSSKKQREKATTARSMHLREEQNQKQTPIPVHSECISAKGNFSGWKLSDSMMSSVIIYHLAKSVLLTGIYPNPLLNWCLRPDAGGGSCGSMTGHSAERPARRFGTPPISRALKREPRGSVQSPA